MAEKIVYLAERPGLLRTMGDAARARVEERFTLSLTAQRFEALLEKIVR
jgi:glycosyltransferase involved in cell wall biosynthesis